MIRLSESTLSIMLLKSSSHPFVVTFICILFIFLHPVGRRVDDVEKINFGGCIYKYIIWMK